MILKEIFVVQMLKLLELLIPIITIPILIKMFGLSGYGHVTLFLSVANYVILIGDWGFNINAVRYFCDSDKIEGFENVKVYIDIQKVKVFFSILVSICSFLYGILNEVNLNTILLFNIWCLTNLLICRWYFQAKSVLNKFVLVSFVSKCIGLIYIYAFMNNTSHIEQYLYVLIFSVLIIAIYTNIYVICNERKKIISNYYTSYFFSFNLSSDYKKLFIEGWALISSRLISNAYNPIILIISKSFFGLDIVGLIGFCQRIVTGVISVLMPIVEVTFPAMVRSYKISIFELHKKMFIIGVFILFMFLFYMIFLFIFKDFIFYFFKINDKQTFGFLLVYSFLIPFSLINSLLVNGLVIKSMPKNIVKYTLIGCIGSFIYLYLGILMQLGYIVIAHSFIFSSLISMVLMIYCDYARKNHV